MAPPRNHSAGPEGPGDRREGEERSVRTKTSREGREWCLGSRERRESPQLNIESMGEGDCGGNRSPPGPGGILQDTECKCDLEIGECNVVPEEQKHQ